MANYHVTVRGSDRAAMADLVRVHQLRVYPQTLSERADGSFVDAVADDQLIEQLQAAGYHVERHEDVDEDARASLQDVGSGNRFTTGPAGPAGPTGPADAADAAGDEEGGGR